MYGNTKSRRSSFSGSRRRSGAARQTNNRGRGAARPLNSDLFVNKAAPKTNEEKYVAKHRFNDFSLHPIIKKNIERQGFSAPTPIQDKSIPLLLQGKDVIGIADTGTGKTAAFLLPLLTKLAANRGEKALIIVPTRELAVQIEDEFKKFGSGLGVYTAVCIGQTSMGTQLRNLSRNPQLIIGTPGRLKDHATRGSLRLSQINNLVVDEADRLVDMGFIETLRELIKGLGAKRQSLFFSATITPPVEGLIRQFMNNAETVSVKNRDTSLNVEQDIVRYTDQFHRMSLLHELLIKPEFKKVLIFGRTKHGVEKLNTELLDRGFTSVSVHGNKNQGQRQRALQQFKDNKTQIMVATDVAARGLDIPDVTHVINFEAPENHADYIHRIGRTGRADKQGVALTFVR